MTIYPNNSEDVLKARMMLSSFMYFYVSKETLKSLDNKLYEHNVCMTHKREKYVGRPYALTFYPDGAVKVNVLITKRYLDGKLLDGFKDAIKEVK